MIFARTSPPRLQAGRGPSADHPAADLPIDDENDRNPYKAPQTPLLRRSGVPTWKKFLGGAIFLSIVAVPLLFPLLAYIVGLLAPSLFD